MYKVDPIKIVALIGSPYQASISELAVKEVIRGCGDVKLIFDPIELRNVQYKQTQMVDVQKGGSHNLLQRLYDADAVILSSPEENNRYNHLFNRAFTLFEGSGILENKFVACIGLGNNATIGGAHALISLLEVCARLHAIPLSSSLYIPFDNLVLSNGTFVAFSQTVFQQLHYLGKELIFRVHLKTFETTETKEIKEIKYG